jgi:hypothetical protein
MKKGETQPNSPFCVKAEGRNFPDLSGILLFIRRNWYWYTKWWNVRENVEDYDKFTHK